MGRTARPDDRPIIIGAGLAGLMAALHLAPEPVIVLAKSSLGAGAASAWAQGGIAAAIGPDDSPELHAADTIAAGDGLCDPWIVTRITAAAPDAIEDLVRRGVNFDRTSHRQLALGLEAAHSRRRIVHAGGDATGREIMRALVQAVRQTLSITVLEHHDARRLILCDGKIAGVLAARGNEAVMLPGSRVVMATGGIGSLYRDTTNPNTATADGLALAARAGARFADLEFVQFHPTALAAGTFPMPLVSEAVRGEGALLIDESGERIMAAYQRGELEPRDVVARAVWQRICGGHRVFLDARMFGSRFAERFPGIAEKCRNAGISPYNTPIPVRPAVHYHMGGILVDGMGRSSVSGLWACGEVTATGLHGANRLASNSLLEAAVCARWVAESIVQTPEKQLHADWSVSLPLPPDTTSVRDIMTENAGILRNRSGLLAAIETFGPTARSDSPATDPALVGLLIASAALAREESRGAHFRTDFPQPSAEWKHRLAISLTNSARPCLATIPVHSRDRR